MSKEKNLELYNRVRSVPENAKKTIEKGRLAGFTDINPMWRIKTLTNEFGVCGLGWYYEINKMWSETCGNEVCAFVEINLYINDGSDWSKPILGIGGSKMAAAEKGGIHVSDECYKMALTDAISVACKFLGIGADVYWDKDKTKYDTVNQQENNRSSKPKQGTDFPKLNAQYCEVIAEAKGITSMEVYNQAMAKVGSDAPEEICKLLCSWMRKIKQ